MFIVLILKEKFKNIPVFCGSVFLVLVGVVVSTIHFNSFYYRHDVPKWMVFDIGVSVFIFYSVLKGKFDDLNIGVLGLVNIIIILLMAFSLIWAPNTYVGFEWVVRYILASLLVVCLSNNFSYTEIKLLFLRIMVCSALAFCIVLIFERYIFKISRDVGAYSPLGFQNNAGHVFNVWIPVLSYLFLINIRKLMSIVYLSILLILIFVLIEAATRGAILGLFIGELIVIFLLLRKDRKMAARFITITTLMMVTLGASQLIEPLKSEKLAAKISRMQSGLSNTTRLPMFKNTWSMTLDNPIGVGVNNFEYIHPKYAQAGLEGKKSPFVNERQILKTPHNYPLKVFSEIGLVGGILTIFLYVVIFIRGARNALKGDFLDKWLLVSFVAVCFHSLVSGVFLNPASLFFSALLISFILKRAHTPSYKQFSIPLKKLILFQVMVVPVLSFMWLSSHLYAYQGNRDFDVDRLKQALLLNPGNERAWFDLSRIQYQKYQDTEGSLQSINRFIALYPFHIKGLYLKAQREIELKKYAEARYTLTRLLKIYPGYKQAKFLKKRLQRNLHNTNSNQTQIK